MKTKMKIRSMIVAPKGSELLAFDLSQAESWIVAYLANEPNMKWALQNSDIHALSGVAIFHPKYSQCKHKWTKNDDGSMDCQICNVHLTKEQRYLGKRTNHASSYGMTPERETDIINAESDEPPYLTVTLAEVKPMATNWHQFFQIKQWWASIQDELNKTRTLVTPYGRSRTFFGFWNTELFKEAYAYIPQSTVSDHFNGARQILDIKTKEKGPRGGIKALYNDHVKKGHFKIVNHSHDSCLLVIPKPISNDLIHDIINKLQRPLIINGESFTIPVDGERGDRYGELEKINV